MRASCAIAGVFHFIADDLDLDEWIQASWDQWIWLLDLHQRFADWCDQRSVDP